MKRLAALLLLLVVACGAPAVDGDVYGDWLEVGTKTWYAEITILDGRVIPCLVWTGDQEAGMSCDWNPR